MTVYRLFSNIILKQLFLNKLNVRKWLLIVQRWYKHGSPFLLIVYLKFNTNPHNSNPH